MRGAATGAAAAVLTAVLLLNGCNSVTSSASPSASGSEKTLVVAEQVEPSSLNPALLQGTVSSLVGGILYSFLLTDDMHGNQIPDAATEVPTLANGGISPDGLRITYHLRPGIRWSDGKPLTAQDCVFTWRAIMNPKTNVPDRYGYDKISAVTAPDDRTVVVHLAKPFSPIVDTFLTMDSNYPILPEHKPRDAARPQPCRCRSADRRSGPFVLSEWEHGDHLTFVANPTYFRGRPKLDKLVMRFVPDTATIVNELRTHEIDAAPMIAGTLYDQVSAIRVNR